MRTMSLLGLVAALMLVLAMATENSVMTGIILLTHVICLLVMAKNDDALAFAIEHTRAAMVLEIAMFGTAAVTLALFMNEYVFLSVLSAAAYAGTWFKLLSYAPPYPSDFGMFAALPEETVDEER